MSHLSGRNHKLSHAYTSLPLFLIAAKSYINGFSWQFLRSFLELTQVTKVFGGKGGGVSASFEEDAF